MICNVGEALYQRFVWVGKFELSHREWERERDDHRTPRLVWLHWHRRTSSRFCRRRMDSNFQNLREMILRWFWEMNRILRWTEFQWTSCTEPPAVRPADRSTTAGLRSSSSNNFSHLAIVNSFERTILCGLRDLGSLQLTTDNLSS